MNDLSTWPMSLPGSKRRMIRKLWPLMPRPGGDRRFVLPFFGTGADAGFILDQGFRVAASDSQGLLIRWHIDVVNCVNWARSWADETERLIADVSDGLEVHGAESKAETILRFRYDQLREAYNLEPEACSLWLLGRLAYGQLIRHNRSGEFNAPFGELRKLPTPERIQAHERFIDSLDWLEVLDFELAALRAEPGDVVYMDPPYYGTFDAYTAQPFDHDRLIAVVMRLRSRGITWALSNSLAFVDVLLAAAPELRDEITIHTVPRSGAMNSKHDARQAVGEVLITWSPKS